MCGNNSVNRETELSIAFRRQIREAQEKHELEIASGGVGLDFRFNRKAFQLNPPARVAEAKKFVSGKILKLNARLKVAPRSAVVLWFGKN